jgi:hypothetical protein
MKLIGHVLGAHYYMDLMTFGSHLNHCPFLALGYKLNHKIIFLYHNTKTKARGITKRSSP